MRTTSSTVRKRRGKKRSASTSAYVKRPSQITKRAPTKRLRKRRVKNITKPTRGRFPNPSRSTQSRSARSRPLLFVIRAKKGAGKKMHFDGTNFSERAKVALFKTMALAETKARSLLAKFPILRNYRVTIEPNF